MWVWQGVQEVWPADSQPETIPPGGLAWRRLHLQSRRSNSLSGRSSLKSLLIGEGFKKKKRNKEVVLLSSITEKWTCSWYIWLKAKSYSTNNDLSCPLVSIDNSWLFTMKKISVLQRARYANSDLQGWNFCTRLIIFPTGGWWDLLNLLSQDPQNFKSYFINKIFILCLNHLSKYGHWSMSQEKARGRVHPGQLITGAIHRDRLP